MTFFTNDDLAYNVIINSTNIEIYVAANVTKLLIIYNVSQSCENQTTLTRFLLPFSGLCRIQISYFSIYTNGIIQTT